MLDAVTELALLETPLSTSCTLVATTGGSRCRVGVGAALGRATTTDDTGDEEISDAGAEIEASTRSGSAGRGASRTGGTGGACAGRGMVTIVVVCCGSPGTYWNNHSAMEKQKSALCTYRRDLPIPHEIR